MFSKMLFSEIFDKKVIFHDFISIFRSRLVIRMSISGRKIGNFYSNCIARIGFIIDFKVRVVRDGDLVSILVQNEHRRFVFVLTLSYGSLMDVNPRI